MCRVFFVSLSLLLIIGLVLIILGCTLYKYKHHNLLYTHPLVSTPPSTQVSSMPCIFSYFGL